MLPFTLHLEAGQPISEQMVYAIKKAIVAGHLRPGDSFPSVRSLSKELKINPNTAHKVVNELVNVGLLEIHPGIGTVVSSTSKTSHAERTQLLGREIESLVVEAKRLSVTLPEILHSVADHWQRLGANGVNSTVSARIEEKEENA